SASAHPPSRRKRTERRSGWVFPGRRPAPAPRMQQAGQRPGSAVLSCLILTPPPIERPGGTMTPLLSPRTKTSKMAQPLPGMKPRPDQTLALNMKLLSHHELQGFGGIGEGMGMQLARDGRRILWLAHESAPKNFTAVDISDPKSPKVVAQTELPHAKVRSNSLDVVGDTMAVADQARAWATPRLPLRAIRSSTRAFARTTPTSFRSGPTAPMSATSPAAR